MCIRDSNITAKTHKVSYKSKKTRKNEEEQRYFLSLIHILPYMDEDMRQLAAAAVNKLQAMTDSEFSEREFILTDEE